MLPMLPVCRSYSSLILLSGGHSVSMTLFTVNHHFILLRCFSTPLCYGEVPLLSMPMYFMFSRAFVSFSLEARQPGAALWYAYFKFNWDSSCDWNEEEVTLCFIIGCSRKNENAENYQKRNKGPSDAQILGSSGTPVVLVVNSHRLAWFSGALNPGLLII